VRGGLRYDDDDDVDDDEKKMREGDEEDVRARARVVLCACQSIIQE
jgi:hypothetical protein